MRYPRPLRRGDRVGVTAPSSGVPPELEPRFDRAVRTLEARGFEVVVGHCIAADRIVSAPAAERAAELMGLLLDPTVAAVIPPWGGEIGIDLLPLLDWDALRAGPATWMVGYSDTSTLLTPLTLLTGTATIHGSNLFDTPYRPPEGLAHWLDVATLEPGASFEQQAPPRVASCAPRYDAQDEETQWRLDEPGGWRRLDGNGPVDVSGRLIGGCIETMCNVAGTPYADVGRFARDHADEGLIVYVEAAEHDAASICRNLHGMRLAGFFQGARAVVFGRTQAPGFRDFSQHEAALDALGPLGVPIIADVECGHVPPLIPLVNGALARLQHDGGTGTLTQHLR